MRYPHSLCFAFALSLPLAASCGMPEAEETDEPWTSEALGKADLPGLDRGPFGFGAEAAVSGALKPSASKHRYQLAVAAGAVVTLEVTRAGTSQHLDTLLFLYAPGAKKALVVDDNDGWGKHSRIGSFKLAKAGTYEVVVALKPYTKSGTYRLAARCESGNCAPASPGGNLCPASIAAKIQACVADQEADPDHDSSLVTRFDLIDQCVDAEVIAEAWDSLCLKSPRPAACGASLAEFSETQLPICRHEATRAELDKTCVFGRTYGDLYHRPDAVVIISARDLTASSPLTSLEQQQILKAVRKTTAYSDVKNVAEAFAAVDEGVVHQHQLWDASGRRAFTVYEVGAGDNSFGLYFKQGTLEQAARIQDSDVVDCKVTWGPERRSCAAKSGPLGCAAGLPCVGLAPEAGLTHGRCVDLSKDTHPSISAGCVGQDGCPAGSGLVCGANPPTGAGLCLPAWMRGAFVSTYAVSIPDNSAKGVEAQLLGWGLATVDVAVTLDLHISHPRISDLLVTLVNPAGNEVAVHDRTGSGVELALHGHPVQGLSGDESVNGIWKLKVADLKNGKTGTLHRFALTITSRWD